MENKATRKLAREVFAFAHRVHQQLTELQQKLDEADVMTQPAGNAAPSYQDYRVAYAHQIDAVVCCLQSLGVKIPHAMLTAHYEFVQLVRDGKVSPLFMSDELASNRHLGKRHKSTRLSSCKGGAAAAVRLLKDHNNIRLEDGAKMVAKAISAKGWDVAPGTVTEWREHATSGKNPQIRKAYLHLIENWKPYKDLLSIELLIENIADQFARLPKL